MGIDPPILEERKPTRVYQINVNLILFHDRKYYSINSGYLIRIELALG